MYLCTRKLNESCKFHAQVAELVDAHVSGACVERRAGSIPVLGTKRLIERSTFFVAYQPCKPKNYILNPNPLAFQPISETKICITTTFCVSLWRLVKF